MSDSVYRIQRVVTTLFVSDQGRQYSATENGIKAAALHYLYKDLNLGQQFPNLQIYALSLEKDINMFQGYMARRLE